MFLWGAAVIGALLGAAMVTPAGRRMRVGRALLGVPAGIGASVLLFEQLTRATALQLARERVATGEIDVDSLILASNAMHAGAVAVVAGVVAAVFCAGGRHPRGRAGEIEDEERLRAEVRDRIARERAAAAPPAEAPPRASRGEAPRDLRALDK